MDVQDDGNCFFRVVLYVCECGDQYRHGELRSKIADHVIVSGKQIFAFIIVSSEGNECFRKCVDALRQNGSCTGEDVILALYMLLPLLVAFYEPRHYVAVVPPGFKVTSSNIGQHDMVGSLKNVPRNGSTPAKDIQMAERLSARY